MGVRVCDYHVDPRGERCSVSGARCLPVLPLGV